MIFFGCFLLVFEHLFPEGLYLLVHIYWLVVWNIFFPCIGNKNPN